MPTPPGLFRPGMMATLAGLILTANPASPAPQAPGWRTLYASPPEARVDLVLVQESGLDALVCVTGPQAEIACSSLTASQSVPPVFLPPAGVASRYVVSVDGSALARIDITPHPTGPKTKFSLFNGQLPAGDFQVAGHAQLLLGSRGDTVVAFRNEEAEPGTEFLSVHDANGEVRVLPWTAGAQMENVLDLEISGDGRRLALRRGTSVDVFDCSPGGQGGRVYGVPPAGAVHLDASGSLLAARQPREVVFYRDGVEFYRFTTSGPPLDVVFGGPAMAVVLESEAVHRIRLATPPVVVSHAAQAGTEFRSLSLSAPGPGGARRIAVGARSPLPQGWRGWVEIVGPPTAGSSGARRTPHFEFKIANRRSPQVRFLDTGRLLVSTRDLVLVSDDAW